MRRPTVVVTHRSPAEGGESPNAYKPEVTVEVRVSWPPAAAAAVVTERIHEASEAAVREHLARRAASQ